MLPIISVLVFAWLPGPAVAHHNKGMPHYGYFENYAQVPTEEYLTIQGRWEMGATFFNFQGLDRRTADTPNDVKIYIYLYDRQSKRGWEERVEFAILQDGESIATFVREHVDEESVYSTRETIPRSGDYELVAQVDGDRVVLSFHIDLASDGVRWHLIFAWGLPAFAVFALAFYGRSRRKRPRMRARKAMQS